MMARMVTWSKFPLIAVVASLAACGGGGKKTYIDPPVRAELVLTSGQATITWESSDAQRRTLIARTLGSVEATPPDGGAVGDSLGSGFIVALTETERFVDNKLPDSCGPFAWHLWAQAEDGTWASSALTVRSLRGAHTLPPTAEVTDVVSAVEAGKLRLSWTPPEIGTNFVGVNVYRKIGSAPTGTNDATLVYSGASTATLDALSNLSATQSTFYAIYNCNECGKCGATAPTLEVPPVADGGVTLDISNLTAAVSADGQAVQLAWVSNAPRVKVLRKLNDVPSGLDDSSSEVVFDGPGTAASEAVTKLLPDGPLNPRLYTYRAWACSGTLCSGMPAKAELRLTLRQALKGGGYTLFMRHATAGVCMDNTALGKASNATTPNWWKSCDSTCAPNLAQQLTTSVSTGEITTLRTFFQTSGVLVSRVLSSEFCRAVQTAQGLGLSAPLEQSQALTYFVYDEADRCLDTMSLLGAAPAAGTNTLHVGHTQYAASCLNLDGLTASEVAVFRPEPGAPPRFVTRVLIGAWETLP